MDISIKCMVAISLVAFAMGLMPARADIRIWSGSTGDWSDIANWTTAVPVDGDDVVITNRGAFVLLTNATPWLSSMVISNASLACSNWNTTIYVTNLTILSSGILTCAGPFTNTAMSNRVNVTCTNLFIETYGAINVKGNGYSGGINGANYMPGHGPGGGVPGAGHGGEGGGQGTILRTGTVYGSATAPLYPGSGGRSGSGAGVVGGCGGGAVCITAAQVVVNGSINADATQSTGSGRDCGGSGGSIYITCITINGTNGVITADGSSVRNFFASSIPGGGGGGGRIAVLYDQVSQNLLPVPSIRFSAAAGMGGVVTNAGDIGTLYFPNNYFFSPTNLFNGQWLAPGDINIALSDWTVSNTWARLSASSITITNTLTVTGTNCGQFKLEVMSNTVINCGQILISGASFILGSYNPNEYTRTLNLATSGPTMNCSGDLTLTNNGRFYIVAGLTNSGAADGYGARVNVGGDIRIADNSWIFPSAHSTNGAAVLFSMRNLNLDPGGGFNANNLGYAGAIRVYGSDGLNPAYGPGAGDWNFGSGYGGRGSGTGAGLPYGNSNAPVAPGSGARASGNLSGFNSAWGGGSVQIRASDTVTLNGKIMASMRRCDAPEGYANGDMQVYYKSPGSSGGAIYITCRTFIGSSDGLLQANSDQVASGYAGGYGGGGGRIAVWRLFDRSTGVISNDVNGGCGTTGTGAPGTIVLGWIVPAAGSIVSVY